MPLPRGKFPMPVRKVRYPLGHFNHRRTLEYLNRESLHLKNSIKVITISYNPADIPSAGLRQFLTERIPQIQYKNPSVQILGLKGQHQSVPRLTLYHEDGNKIYIECDGKKSSKIFEELSSVARKPEWQLMEEKKEEEINPANFGDMRKGRFCMCEIPGQVSCPSIKPLANVQHKWKERNNSN
jgi:small subunit ribosomal protein S25